MKRALTIFAILTPFTAMAAGPVPIGPNGGQYGDWTAATYGTGDAKICYAFTKPQKSEPVLLHRGLAMLTITQRGSGRDEVSLTPGYTLPAHASVTLEVGKSKIPFYIENNVAFTNDTKIAIAGFTRENTTTTVSSAPDGRMVTDHFSLRGFTAAHQAISKACP